MTQLLREVSSIPVVGLPQPKFFFGQEVEVPMKVGGNWLLVRGTIVGMQHNEVSHDGTDYPGELLGWSYRLSLTIWPLSSAEDEILSSRCGHFPEKVLTAYRPREFGG